MCAIGVEYIFLTGKIFNNGINNFNCNEKICLTKDKKKKKKRKRKKEKKKMKRKEKK